MATGIAENEGILLDMSEDELIGIAEAAAVLKRSGDIAVKPGFDGEFGKIRCWRVEEVVPAGPVRPGSLIA